MQPYSLSPGKLTLDTIYTLLQSKSALALHADAWQAITESEKFVKDLVKKRTKVYGINTGFGLLANTIIPPADLETLQNRILLSHAAGIGEFLPEKIVKLILLLKINGLSRGYSGVRAVLIEILIQFYNHEIYPCIPSKGSVGASGDLAPLAHLSLPLIGKGQAYHKGRLISGLEALELIGQKPLSLEAKEGLALINGTQVSTAIALYYTFKAQELLTAGIFIGTMSVDAALGCDTAFHPLIHEIRGQIGQITVAKILLEALEGSEIRNSHLNCTRVQDPYCLRCQPQVLGASLDNINHAASILEREANAVTDNPLIFCEDNLVLSGGNFHAEPVAQAADLVAIALSEVGALAERRIALLIDPHFNQGLPPFLTKNPGLNSGFMIGHVTAAALASANKSLAHPASVDSLPTSANQEDHVSMATFAACRLKDIVENVEGILTIELLAACQGIDLRQPLKTSKRLASIHRQVRLQIATWEEDRLFADDINKAKSMVTNIGKEQLHLIMEHYQNQVVNSCV